MDNCLAPKVTTSNCFFCPTSSPETNEPSFTVMDDNDEQQILTFKKLEATVLAWKMTETICLLPKQLAVNLILIDQSAEGLMIAALLSIRTMLERETL